MSRRSTRTPVAVPLHERLSVNRERANELMSLGEPALKKRARIAELRLNTALLESQGELLFSGWNPLNPDEWPGSAGWIPVADRVGLIDPEQQAADGFATEQDQMTHRRVCRTLARGNGFAINALENLVAYTVGSGFKYRFRPKDPEVKENDESNKANEAVEDFVEDNKWGQREQEIVRRDHRDGESFIRGFKTVNPGEDTEGGRCLQIRIIEPGEVKTPESKVAKTIGPIGSPNSGTVRMGIEFEPEDAETPIQYYVGRNRPEPIPASEITHSKKNVDRNVSRGISTLWPIRGHLDRAERVLRNMSAVASIQAAIALIRKHKAGATSGMVSNFLNNQVDFTGRDAVTSKTQQAKIYRPGTILDVGENVDYDFPAGGIDASKFVEIEQADLRAACARLVLPEFMLTMRLDAKYMNAFAAEGPTSRMFEREQAYYKDIFGSIIWEAVAYALDTDVDTLRETLELQVEAPVIAYRDPYIEAQANLILNQAGVLSVQTWSSQAGLDYDAEQRNREAHTELTGDMGNLPMPTGGDPNQPEGEPPTPEGGAPKDSPPNPRNPGA